MTSGVAKNTIDRPRPVFLDMRLGAIFGAIGSDVAAIFGPRPINARAPDNGLIERITARNQAFPQFTEVFILSRNAGLAVDDDGIVRADRSRRRPHFGIGIENRAAFPTACKAGNRFQCDRLAYR